ncbi:MAG: hypothetical protein WBQ34_12050 [Candidatus Acidiferrales bacterium]
MTQQEALQEARRREVIECHPEGSIDCYCDNGHAQNNTVCMFCFYGGEAAFADADQKEGQR